MEKTLTTNQTPLISTNSTKTFRRYLQDELLHRCRNNPNYSLRSFAKALQINPSSLSRILRGERAISQKIKSKLGRSLGLTELELKKFYIQKHSLTKQIEEVEVFNQLSSDVFAVISDWYHYAILELVQLKIFKSDPRWVARSLGITVSEVNVALEKLLRLNLLKIDKKGRWVNSSGNNTNVSEDVKASAFRKLQRQVLEMALRALEETPIEFRDQSSMTMAMNKNCLKEAIQKITNFRRDMSQFCEKDSSKNEVYQLSISLYPLTKLTSEGKSK